MAVGPWTWFNKAISKPFDGTMDLDSHAFKAVLLGSAQALDATFVGASGNCQYSDLTAELATANGYTNGGLAMTGLAISSPSASSRKWSASDLSWTLTGAINFKYAAIFDNTAANKDLIGFADFNVGGTTVSASISPLVIVTSAGILTWHT
jgi:hypothetical protein